MRLHRGVRGEGARNLSRKSGGKMLGKQAYEGKATREGGGSRRGR